VERFEWLARKLDGTEMPVDVTLTAVELEGRPVLQAVIIDLTERKRAEAELQNALAKERELSQLKSEFVSLVSHEFRTPLEIILSSADNLRRYHDRLEPAKREQLLQTINRSVRRMSGMMEEVLVLGRLETDRMTFHPMPFDLRAFCQRVSDEIESATNRRCPIHLELAIPAGDANGDESMLRHIFANLLSNAVKYSPEGSVIDFNVSRDGDNAICRVSDHGCGIPASDQKRMFQAFHRGSNVGQIPGTGLGLLIVQRCVELHGGEIQFESAMDRGTTFTVRLPLFPLTLTPAHTLAPDADGGEGKSESRSKGKRE
jgi:signal transduction histidine kinase